MKWGGGESSTPNKVHLFPRKTAMQNISELFTKFTGSRFVMWISCRRNFYSCFFCSTLRSCNNECDGVWNHQPHDCLLNRLFRRRSKETSKLPVTGLCAGNSPVTGEFPTQRARNAENVSIWCRHREKTSSNMLYGRLLALHRAVW